MNLPRVLIYTEEFLSPSMTFIARQMQAIQSHFDVSVLARARRNSDLFKFEPIDIVPTTGLERLTSSLHRKFKGREWKIAGGVHDAIESAISRRMPDLIHAHFGPSGLAILPFAQAQQIPLVTTFHGFDASSYLARSVYRRDLSRLFDYGEIVTVSQDMRQNLIRLGANPKRIHCHYIGVPLDSFKVPKRQPVAEKLALGKKISFLQVSNFVEKKGHEFTVRAFSELVDKFPNCELVLAGSGPLVERTMGLVDELGLGGRVCFIGHQDSEAVATRMREADCFLHHSITSANGDKEGIPTVLMEAMATGLPVISTRHSGIPELVEHGVDGLLVGERAVAEYVEAMSLVINGQVELGTRARTKVERMFDIDNCSQGLCRLYDAIINGVEASVTSNSGSKLS